MSFAIMYVKPILNKYFNGKKRVFTRKSEKYFLQKQIDVINGLVVDVVNFQPRRTYVGMEPMGGVGVGGAACLFACLLVGPQAPAHSREIFIDCTRH